MVCGIIVHGVRYSMFNIILSTFAERNIGTVGIPQRHSMLIRRWKKFRLLAWNEIGVELAHQDKKDAASETRLNGRAVWFW